MPYCPPWRRATVRESSPVLRAGVSPPFSPRTGQRRTSHLGPQRSLTCQRCSRWCPVDHLSRLPPWARPAWGDFPLSHPGAASVPTCHPPENLSRILLASSPAAYRGAYDAFTTTKPLPPLISIDELLVERMHRPASVDVQADALRIALLRLQGQTSPNSSRDITKTVSCLRPFTADEVDAAKAHTGPSSVRVRHEGPSSCRS